MKLFITSGPDIDCILWYTFEIDIKIFILVGWDRSFLSVALPTGVQMVFFFCSGVSKLLGAQPKDLHRQAAYSICESSFLIYHGIYHYLFVHDDSLTS